ncbi:MULTISPECIES: DJ-1/PfpI family protein [Chryseobacterium]|uniref:Transcriptional regulator GlxA family with amidase domain n=1 Tax=Chryseobacterium camelliae TaxID=1265445 RepID=A0ABU0TDR2_9FLAO|nr:MULTISPECIES: DJ-1/PfpI family protein [Chryseobacterium]MDT3406991.1 transcriptional regulator GlxA family with amidase domain [Pseudacidovorax intermedius]MDQ1095217.1 transcriptional regulator GlxA family with amidase domain [Chryseobacterium camelliae]MDQ1099155.1 transcriptional regulator GlxA family with amidase domain [Chryseobacterium sp. SORGH_AS_1048]MDR6086504.1 transcriptional regulator GlxA family with amidase domain [Chryseobacterium sp. SORGH_AS_0909]MDR6130875.1 transcriptio
MKIVLRSFVAAMLLSGCHKEPMKKEIQPTETSVQKPSAKEHPADAMTSVSHAQTMDAVFGKPKKEIRTIGILVYDGVNDLDFMNPRYVLGQVMGAKVMLIALKPGLFKTVSGISVQPDTTIDKVQKLDILIIPGGFKGTVKAAYDEKLLDWIRKIDQTTVYTGSVCTGAWILGATGLLKGRKATTNWFDAKEKMAQYGAHFVQERYTHDGKYWTSAGVTAGLDMSLAILKDNWGSKYAQAVMLDLEYDPAPPVEGGTPERTDPDVRQMITELYKAGFNPVIDSLERVKNNQLGR